MLSTSLDSIDCEQAEPPPDLSEFRYIVNGLATPRLLTFNTRWLASLCYSLLTACMKS